MRVGIIGGGPAGYSAALLGAKKGWDVTLFERKDIGGTCLNRGCIPTKSLINSALHGLPFEEAKKRKELAKRRLVLGVERLLQKAGVKVIGKEARLEERKIITDDEVYEFDRILVATGSVPSFPPIEGKENAKTSEDALELHTLPERVIIIGGGVIGLEFAFVLSSFGSEVHVVEIMEEVLPGTDPECASVVRKELEKKGIRFYLRKRVERIEEKKIYGEVELEGDAVFLFTGRKPCLENLPPEIRNENGVKVDEYLETPIPGVFAAGDCTGQFMLAHYAYHQAEVAVENMEEKRVRCRRNAVPGTVFTHPEYAWAGEMEGESVKVPFSANGRAIAEGDTAGFVKLFYKEGRVTGIHIVGGRASELIFSATFMLGKKLEELRWSIPPHPTNSELLKEAVLAALGTSIHC